MQQFRTKYSDMIYPQKVLRFIGIYGIGLGFLVSSSSFDFNKYGMGLILKNIETTGPLGLIWRDWHAIGCFGVGFMAYVASTWNYKDNKQAVDDILKVTSFVFTTWSLQNLNLSLRNEHVTPKPLFLHVALCGAAGLASFSAINYTKL